MNQNFLSVLQNRILYNLTNIDLLLYVFCKVLLHSSSTYNKLSLGTLLCSSSTHTHVIIFIDILSVSLRHEKYTRSCSIFMTILKRKIYVFNGAFSCNLIELGTVPPQKREEGGLLNVKQSFHIEIFSCICIYYKQQGSTTSM